jgi:photosystem II protein
MVPVAMFAWFKSQTVAKPLLPTSQWAMAAEAGAEAESAPRRRATMQFIRGVDETDVPDVQLKRSRDGSSGSAVFTFNNASLFDAQFGEVSGLYMTDEEGTISTTQCTAKFVNGNPSCIEATYVMRSAAEWNRYMRFMERYAEENGLGFSKSS